MLVGHGHCRKVRCGGRGVGDSPQAAGVCGRREAQASLQRGAVAYFAYWGIGDVILNVELNWGRRER